MRIGQIIGTVTLSRVHPSLGRESYRLAWPVSLAELRGAPPEPNETVVIYDELSTGVGDVIAFSEGGEAAQPFYPEAKPVDAYAAAILDTINLEDA